MRTELIGKKSLFFLGVFVLILCLSSACVGYVIGGSNFGIGGYPSFGEYRPSAPYSKESYAVDSYRSEVESYRYEAEEYIENAEDDIRRIQEAIDDTIDDLNSVIQEYNNFVSF